MGAINDPLGQINIVLPVAITILSLEICFVLRDFEKVEKEGQTPRVKIVITTGLDCGWASWINCKEKYFLPSSSLEV